MNLLCLCPTYGRRRELLENTLACFFHQDYPPEKRRLILFDDLGTLASTKCDIPSVIILSQSQRCSSIADKYRVILERIDSNSYDAVIVWDDDDIYLPWHLRAHAAVLAGHGWSKPSWIWSAYHNPPQLESAAGRFHGSIAIRRDLLNRIGGWVQTKRADFDQQMISRLRQEEPLGDPCFDHCFDVPVTAAPTGYSRAIQSPGYVYRWQSTRASHCSGWMWSPENEDWYNRVLPDCDDALMELKPQLDYDSRCIITRTQL